jgi:hypothetical protein
MMASMLTSWTALLSQRFDDVNDEYGPNTQAVASAFAVLSKTQWLEHGGEPLDNNRVTVVPIWDDVLTIFQQNPQYNVNGVLRAPCVIMDDALARSPERYAWWQKAREDAIEYTVLGGIPRSRSLEERDLVYEYLYEFVSMLLVEVIVSPETHCTYFREQLAWFHAGRFPCGWDGDWPSGRMRVY